MDDSGRPQITFDPCLDIPDGLLVDAGYDPRSKEKADYPMGSYSFLGCRYEGTVRIPGVLRRYGLSILSGNVTIEEELLKDADIASEIEIDGHRALLEVGPRNKNSCAIVLQTSFGITMLNRRYWPDHTRDVPQSEWCVGLADLATKIAPLVGADRPHG